MLTERQKLAIYVALSYAQSNIEDINDVFANVPDDSMEAPDDGEIIVSGEVHPPFNDEELIPILVMFEPPLKS